MVLVLLCDLARACYQSAIGRNRQNSIKVSYHLAKVGGHRYSASGDILFLVCQVILQDQVIKGSCGFMGGSPLCKSPPCQVW